MDLFCRRRECFLCNCCRCCRRRLCKDCCSCHIGEASKRIKNEYEVVRISENTAELLVCGRKIQSNTLVTCKLKKTCR